MKGGGLVHRVDVIGDEDRFQIPQEMSYFTDAGGLLSMKIGDGESRCTGYLIAEEWLLTSAHCVIRLTSGERARAIVFDPGLVDPRDFTHPREYATEFWVLRDAADMIDRGAALGRYGPTAAFMEKDIAVIYIPTMKGRKPIPRYPVHLQTPDSPEKRVYMQTAGYPSDKDTGSYWFARCDGMLMSGFDIFETVCDAVPGQSGSVVVQIWSPEDLADEEYPVPYKPVVVGVISAVSQNTTLVTAMTQPLIDEIHGLIGKTDAPYPSFARYKVKRDPEHRVFVNNTCDRPVSIFAQTDEKTSDGSVKKIRGWNLDPGQRGQILTSRFVGGQIIPLPADVDRLKLSRSVYAWRDQKELGPLKKIWVPEKEDHFLGYDFEFGQAWTDSRLVIECVD
jgi:hypothetical protein